MVPVSVKESHGEPLSFLDITGWLMTPGKDSCLRDLGALQEFSEDKPAFFAKRLKLLSFSTA
jgi:hypothetical protein